MGACVRKLLIYIWMSSISILFFDDVLYGVLFTFVYIFFYDYPIFPSYFIVFFPDSSVAKLARCYRLKGIHGYGLY